jgi:hypothetical protein
MTDPNNQEIAAVLDRIGGLLEARDARLRRNR